MVQMSMHWSILGVLSTTCTDYCLGPLPHIGANLSQFHIQFNDGFQMMQTRFGNYPPVPQWQFKCGFTYCQLTTLTEGVEMGSYIPREALDDMRQPPLPGPQVVIPLALKGGGFHPEPEQGGIQPAPKGGEIEAIGIQVLLKNLCSRLG